MEHDFPRSPQDSQDSHDSEAFASTTEPSDSLFSPAEQNSPYEEVRMAVDPTDDPTVNPNTIRMWVIGMLWATLGSSANMFFSLRNPSVSLSVLVAALLAYPCLTLWDRVMPNRDIRIGSWCINLNPSPFTMKEHALVVIMANVSFGSAYATDIILAQRVFYKQHFGFAYEILLTLATQVLGYGLAGLSRRFLVYPASMIWPSNLIQCSLLRNLHQREVSSTGSSDSYRWFLYVFVGAFLYYWIPGYFVSAVSSFAIITYFFPTSRLLNQLFGQTSGLSLLPLSLDWSQITAYLGSPLMYPVDAIVNIILGVILFFWILTPALFYSNVWRSQNFPLFASNAYDQWSQRYQVGNILTPQVTFDASKYEAYSPIYLPVSYALAFGLSFASIAAVITHVACFHGKEILRLFRERRGHTQPREEATDIHASLMRAYPEVPSQWYLGLFMSFSIVMGVVCLGWPTETPLWTISLGILIATVMFLPVGVVQAITNYQLGLNVLAEFVIGYLLPGRPLAMMIFKTVTYITMAQGLSFAADLKFGHYMKLPPRITFWTQLVATLWSCIVQIGVLDWSLVTIPEICSPSQVDHYTCPGATVFFTSSVIWGVIGPQRIFSLHDGMYRALQWFWVIGLLGPIGIYAISKRWPQSIWSKLNVPILFGGNGSIPPATPMNYMVWGFWGILFNHTLRRRAKGWWERYNFTVSAALDTGTELAILVIFFSLLLPRISLHWWGNDGYSNTLDANFTAHL